MPKGVYERKPLSQEHKMNISMGHRGNKLSEETKKKIGLSNSIALKGKHKGNENPHWKGGIIKDVDGYILVKQSNHPHKQANGYVRRARLVMEKMIGRYLTPEETVHHKGVEYPLGSMENKQDDRPINLQLFSSNRTHISFHASHRVRNGKGMFN